MVLTTPPAPLLCVQLPGLLHLLLHLLRTASVNHPEHTALPPLLPLAFATTCLAGPGVCTHLRAETRTTPLHCCRILNTAALSCHATLPCCWVEQTRGLARCAAGIPPSIMAFSSAATAASTFKQQLGRNLNRRLQLPFRGGSGRTCRFYFLRRSCAKN